MGKDSGETEIKSIIKKWLSKKGFIDKAKDKTHGVDIKMWSPKGRKYWFVEVKGWPPSNQKYTWLCEAIGQISLRFRAQKASNYGIALPDIKYYENKTLNELVLFRKRTKIHFFLVTKNGKIRQLTPNSSSYKSIV